LFLAADPTASATFASSLIPPMCMNISLGLPQKKWLCSAVTSRPLSSFGEVVASAVQK
jgi:hypothetical protein